MGRSRELFLNVILVAIGNSGSKLLGLLMMPLYTRWLAPSDFGTADMIFVYVSMLINIVTANISEAVFVFPHGENKANQTKYFTTGSIFLCACLAITLLICGILNITVSEKINDVFFKYIWYIGLLLTSNATLTYIQQFSRSIHRMDVYSFIGVVHSLAVVIFSFLLIPNYGVEGYVLCMIIGYCVAFVYAMLASKSYVYFSSSSFDRAFLKNMLQYSVPLIPNVIVWWLISSLNRPVMEHYVGLAGIGLFAVANKFPSIVNMVFNFFQQAWIVTVLDEFKKPDFGTYYNQMLKIVFLVQITLVFALIYLSVPLIRIFVTDEYYSAWKFIPILSLAVIFTNISAFTGSIFSATRKSKYYFYSSAVGALIAVILNILLIPTWQIWGACASLLVAHMSSAASRIYFSSKIVLIESKSSYVYSFFLFCIAYMSYILIYDKILAILIGSICYLFIFYFNRKTIRIIQLFVMNIRSHK